ncbi:glycosyltransferase family 9 protein [Azospirillum sp. SYSU D00513]|uniref:glycosyltransferase family 9 protein n=1 Tax=Azospirillum sp. SYSU D00513 TaxID=2812561 RepID=UPI001A9615AB|nr:glycosyltransferase family 9 protein [Azospirillum sp. SYSU D00513]
MSDPSREQRVADQLPLAVFSQGELIGDALTKVPFIRALRGLYPDRRIVWVTTNDTHLATTLRPMMDGLIDEFLPATGLGAGRLDLLRPLPAALAGRRFSVVLDTQTKLWVTLLLRRLPRDLFVSRAAGFRLSDRRPAAGYRRPPHIVDRLIDLAEIASGRKAVLDRAAPRLPAEFLEDARRLLPDGGAYVGLAPGAGSRVKCWPLDRYIAVAKAQAERGRTPVFLLGPAELEWMDPLRAAVPGALFPLQDPSLAGAAPSPLRTIAVAGRLGAAIANDSGVSHMVALADVPLLTLYGPTDAAKFSPKVARGRSIAAQSFGGDSMDRIPVEAVLAALEGLIAR